MGKINRKEVEPHTVTRIANNMNSNRISYLFDLHGSSITVDTACSSSLTALDLAVQAIKTGSSPTAIVGGINLLLDPMVYVALSKGKMLSPDGQCKAFDNDANGYVRGEGAIALLLKPLQDAKKDRDHIYAVIKGSAQNHGGKTN